MTLPATPPGAETLIGRLRWRYFLMSFAATLVPLILWALASPLGSIPDEPSHFIRAAAVVRGQIYSEPLASDPAVAQSDVPKYVAQLNQWVCYARQPLITPACNQPVTGDPGAIVRSGSSAGTNNPVFYALVGLPTLVVEGTPALYAMRIVGSLLCAATFGFLIMQLRTIGRSIWAIVGAVVSATPMLLYLGGSVNPNGLEAISAAALFVTLVAFVKNPTSSAAVRWERAIGIVILVVLLLSAKIFALLWLLLAVMAALIFLSKSDLSLLLKAKSTWLLLTGSAIATIAALVWFLHPPVYGLGKIKPIGAFEAFTGTVARTFEFANGYVGIFGWLDTPSPRFSDIIWSTLAVVLIVVALIWGSGRARIAAFGFSAALLVIPPVVQAVLAPQVGYIWQGRYMLAVFLCLLICCGMALDSARSGWWFSKSSRLALIAGLALVVSGQVASFVWVLRRYAVGLEGSMKAMLFGPSWQPPLGWEVLTLAMVVSLTVTAIIVYRWVVRSGLPVKSASPAQVRG